jgi:hypothetical protein
VSGWPPNFNLATLTGNNGFAIGGFVGDSSLVPSPSVSTVGDLNGDGKADLVVGALGADPGNRTNAGAAYVIFGEASNWPANFNLTTLNGTNGFVIEGLAAGDKLGASVSTAGDLNGDGKDDLLVGARYASPGNRALAGTVYVIFSQVSDWPANFDLTTLTGTNGFVIEGLAADDRLGTSVSNAGDLNGDGKDDIVLGANAVDAGGRADAGAAYVIFGQNTTVIPTPTPTPIPTPTPTLTPTPTPTPTQMNRPPIVTHPIPDQSIEVGTPFNFTIASDTFTDPDGDTLTYSAQQVNGSPLPSWVNFDEKGRFFSGMASLAGNTPLSVEATNTGKLSTYANFSLLATPMTSTPSNNAGLIGGIVGGVVAIGVAGLTYLVIRWAIAKERSTYEDL